jgi:hypothetical protein
MSHAELEDLAREFDPKIRGWVNYYGKYYPTALRRTFRCLNMRLVRWTQNKYKRYRAKMGQAARSGCVAMRGGTVVCLPIGRLGSCRKAMG